MIKLVQYYGFVLSKFIIVNWLIVINQEIIYLNNFLALSAFKIELHLPAYREPAPSASIKVRPWLRDAP